MKEKILTWMKGNKTTLFVAIAFWFLGVLMGWKAAGMPIFQRIVG